MRATLALLVGLLAAPALAQPAPPPAVQQQLGHGLFGEDEPQPGDEEAAEATQPPADQPAKPAPAPDAATQKAYDERLRQSYAAAESLQGSLDGGWKVIGARGAALLDLQLVDKGKGDVEGAWRDLRSGPTPAASGLIDRTPVSGGRFSTSFFGGGLPYRLAVSRGADGRWTGQYWRGDERFDVKMEKMAP